MKIQHKKGSDTYVFKSKERTHFLFLPSDLSIFGNPAKRQVKIRGNFWKCSKLLLGNELNEFELILESGDYFEIGLPVLSRGHTKEEVKEYKKTSGGDSMKVEPAKLAVSLTIPPGDAVKVYSIESSFQVYLVNQGGVFYESNDYAAVEEATGVPF